MCTPQWRQLSVVCMHWLRKNSSVCETADPHTPGSKDPNAPRIYPAQCRLTRVCACNRERWKYMEVCACACTCAPAPLYLWMRLVRVMVPVNAIWRCTRSPRTHSPTWLSKVDLSLVHNVVPSFSSEGRFAALDRSVDTLRRVSRRKYVLRFSMLPVLFDRGQGVLSFSTSCFSCSRLLAPIEQTFLRDRVASQLSGFVIGVLAINSNAGKRVSTINIG